MEYTNETIVDIEIELKMGTIYCTSTTNPAQFLKTRTSAKPWWSNNVLADNPDDDLINAV